MNVNLKQMQYRKQRTFPLLICIVANLKLVDLGDIRQLASEACGSVQIFDLTKGDIQHEIVNTQMIKEFTLSAM